MSILITVEKDTRKDKQKLENIGIQSGTHTALLTLLITLQS